MREPPMGGPGGPMRRDGPHGPPPREGRPGGGG
jgi:hypothetical protein